MRHAGVDAMVLAHIRAMGTPVRVKRTRVQTKKRKAKRKKSRKDRRRR